MVVELQTLDITVLILIDELTGINLILETDEVSKLDKSSDVRLKQFLNKYIKFFIDDVLKLDISKNFKDWHPLKRWCIVFKEFVWKFDRFKEVKEVHP